MPLECHVDEARQCVVVKIRGDFELEEIVEMINNAVGDPKFKTGFGILSDHTEVGKPITTQQAKQVVKYFGNLSTVMAGARWAAVTSKAASYGMLRMISALAESVPMDVEVFLTHQEAETWLLESRN